MPEKQRPKISRYDLVSGVDSYASQTSQNPETSRFMQGFVVGDDGALYREWNDPALGTGLPNGAGVKRLFQFDFVDATSTLTRFWFAVIQIALNQYQLWVYNGATWSQVSQVGTLVNVPSFAKVQSSTLLHLSDGVTNWIFDGTSWIIDGFAIPLTSPMLRLGFKWSSNRGWALNSNIIDSNGNMQLVTTNGTGGAFEPLWNTAVGSTTGDGTVVWTCLGPALTPWQSGFTYPKFTSIIDSHGNLQYVSTAGASGATEPAWAAGLLSTTTDSGATWTNLGQLTPGNYFSGSHFFSANGVWAPSTALSRLTLVIDPNGYLQWAPSGGGATTGTTYPVWNTTVGGTTSDGTATWTNAGLVANLAPWQPTLAYSSNQFILDSNGNLQIVTGNGTSGANTPTWNVNIDGTTADGGVTWKNLGAAPSGSTITANVGKYYWLTYADHTPGRVHESTSSPISAGSGPLVHGGVTVYPHAGLFTSNMASTQVTTDPLLGQYAQLTAQMVGQLLYINGTLIGTIASVDLVNRTITLAGNALATIATGYAVICDSRTTHWHLYASESDGSKIGELLYEIPITQNLNLFPVIDVSSFVGEVGNQYTSIFRPVRNDPPPTSLLAEVHKYRIFRRRESRPNFFNFTANEEVSSGVNGDPTECVPGADVNTLSDIVNEQVYPDSSNFIRALCSHGDALYIGTEKQTLPLYGQSIDDFGLSQVTAFSLGIAGRNAMISTAHGLALVSYDRKVFIYPTSNYYWSYVPNDVNVTDNMIEIGKPIRKVLERITSTQMDDIQLVFYFYGRRNWLVLTFPSNNTYQTWVYDFTNKGWFQLAVGYSSISVFELSTGNKTLVAGRPSGGVFVLDDVTGTFVSSGNQPVAVWRPALIDFGDPDSKHIPLYVEIEFSNSLMANDLTLNYYLDPGDVDNPGTPRVVMLQPVMGANLFRGFFQGGNLCQRLLVEFNFAASPVSTNAGAIRGVKLVANPASGLIK